MNRKIKLIWDFRGSEALEIAKQHCLYLKEIPTNQIPERYCTTFIIVDEKDMLTYRDAL